MPRKKGWDARWTAEELQRFIEIIAEDEDYHSLIIHHGNQGQFSFPSKATLCEEIFRKLYPDQASVRNPYHRRLSDKLYLLNITYKRELRRHSAAGQALKMEELEEDSRDWRQRQRTIKKTPWFETWHRIVVDAGKDSTKQASSHKMPTGGLVPSDSEESGSNTDGQESDDASVYSVESDSPVIRPGRQGRGDHRQRQREAEDHVREPRQGGHHQGVRPPPPDHSTPPSISSRLQQSEGSPFRASLRSLHSSSGKRRAEDVDEQPSTASQSAARVTENRHHARRHDRGDDRRGRTTVDRLQVPRRVVDVQASATASSSRTTLQQLDSGQQKRRVEDHAGSAPAIAPIQAATDDRDRSRRYEMGMEIRREALSCLDRHQQLQAKYQETLLKTIALLTEGSKEGGNGRSDSA